MTCRDRTVFATQVLEDNEGRKLLKKDNHVRAGVSGRCNLYDAIRDSGSSESGCMLLSAVPSSILKQ